MQTELDIRYYVVKGVGRLLGYEYYITMGHPKWNHVVTSCADREEAERYIKLLQGS